MLLLGQIVDQLQLLAIRLHGGETHHSDRATLGAQSARHQNKGPHSHISLRVGLLRHTVRQSRCQ